MSDYSGQRDQSGCGISLTQRSTLRGAGFHPHHRSILFVYLHGVTAALRYPSERVAGWDQLPQVERRDLSAGQYDKQAKADKARHGRDGRMREADQFP